MHRKMYWLIGRNSKIFIFVNKLNIGDLYKPTNMQLSNRHITRWLVYIYVSSTDSVVILNKEKNIGHYFKLMNIIFLVI